jgi:rubrerythrin
MEIHTASEGITLARELENNSAEFYEELARRFTKDAGTFLSFAKENKKNITQIDRAYYGVITDAIEGCYAFKINTDNYVLRTSIPEKARYADALAQAVEIEEKIIKFYSDAAEQSKALMADVPRTFMLVAKKRSGRIPQLNSLGGPA